MEQNGSQPGEAKRAKCHPDRAQHADGLCRSCYHKRLLKINPEYRQRQIKRNVVWRAKNPRKVKLYNKQAAKMRKINPELRKRDSLAKRKHKLMINYGMTLDDYNTFYSNQKGLCEICSKPFGVLDVDHDHITNKVRGLLCRTCNTMVGIVESKQPLLAKVNNYLKRYKNE